MNNLFSSGIRPAIDAWLLEKSKEIRSYGDYWSASSAGYCMRRVIFERLGVPKVESDGDARKQRVFTSGHLFHSWIQDITKQAGLSIAQELELQDEELMIRGHIDDLVLIQSLDFKPPMFMVDDELNRRSKFTLIPDRLILYDYKTQNSRAFSYKRPDMSHYHKMQLGTYMYMLRQNKAIDTFSYGGLTEARILKISKDDLRMNEEQLMWSPQLEKEVYEYWSTLNGYWKSKKIPKCTCADFEGGFLAKEAWNGYFFDGEPCSVKLYEKFKEERDAVK